MRRWAQGIALVEIMVSVALLCLVFIFLMNLLPAASLAGHRAGEDAQAVAVAQRLLETARSTPFSQVSALPAPTPVTIDTTVYTPSLEIAPVRGEDPALLVDIKARVWWQVGTLRHEVVQECYVAKVNR